MEKYKQVKVEEHQNTVAEKVKLNPGKKNRKGIKNLNSKQTFNKTSSIPRKYKSLQSLK